MAEAKFIGGQRICDLTARERLNGLGIITLAQSIPTASEQGHYWRQTPTVIGIDTTDTARKYYAAINFSAGTYYFSDIDASFTLIQNRSTLAVKKITEIESYSAANGTVTIDYDFTLYVTARTALQPMWGNGPLPSAYVYGVYSRTYDGVDVGSLQTQVSSLLTSSYSMNHIYVSPNGSDTDGDGTASNPFATIYHANETITDNSESNRYTIHVADGVYTDLETRFAGTTPSSANLQGIRCKSYVTYEGNVSNPAACKLVWNGASGYDAESYTYATYGFYKCPFHVESGKVIIRGFTVEATNTRYATHIECGGYGLGFDWEISDCIFLWHGTPGCTDRTSSPAAIGTGSGNYEKGHLLRCKISNDSGITLGWMNHDSANRYPNMAVYEGAEIVLESCVFNGGALRTSVVWRNINGDNNIDGFDRFSIINCIGINSLTFMLSGTSTVCKWRADIKCSDITNNDFETQGLLQ